MTDWTEIPDANLEPDRPIRSVDGLALRDNPVAIAEGASGAPRLRLSAMDPEVPVQDYVAGNTADIVTLSSGDNDGIFNTESISWRTLFQVFPLRNGTVRIRFCARHIDVGGDGVSQWRIVINGSVEAINNGNRSNTTFGCNQEDIAVQEGDSVLIQARTSAIDREAFFDDFRIRLQERRAISMMSLIELEVQD